MTNLESVEDGVIVISDNGDTPDDEQILAIPESQYTPRYMESMREALAAEYLKTVDEDSVVHNVAIKNIMRDVPVLGKKGSKLGPQQAKVVLDFCRSMGIPPMLNNQPLVNAIVDSKGKVKIHATIECEMAIALTDSRQLEKIDTNVTVVPLDGGGAGIVTKVTVTYANGQSFPGVDYIELASSHTFRDGVQEMLLDNKRREIAEEWAAYESAKAAGKRRGAQMPVIDHHTFTSIQRSMLLVEKESNRNKGHAIRASETFALRRALRISRFRLDNIRELAGYSVLHDIVMNGREELIAALTARGFSPDDILELAEVGDFDAIPDNRDACTKLWRVACEQM